MIYKIIGVHALSLPYHADKEYEYYLPAGFETPVGRGSFVIVPFGGGNKKILAVVTATREGDDISKFKPILSLVSHISLNEEQLGIAQYLKEHIFCSIGDVVKAMIPSAALSRINEIYRALPEKDGRVELSQKALVVWDCIRQSRDGIAASRLNAKFGKEVLSILPKLVEYGYAERITEIKDGAKKKELEIIHPKLSREESERYISGDKKIKGQKRILVLSYLAENGATPAEELYERVGVTKKQVTALCEMGLLEIEKREIMRAPYNIPINADRVSILSEHQKVAFEKISELIDSKEPKAALLHGITGSGKTHVIKAAIDKVVSMGRQVIILVPEIALTPQTVETFCSFYGDRVAVWHSGLSAGERYDAWRKMTLGDADVCIGTRSAVFAPFKNLGMIVIDEEHEHTYKSEQSPRYHARDVARYRCVKNDALMLLSSATPSVESYYKAKEGVYSLIELTERYNSAQLPETVISDLRIDAEGGNVSPIGAILSDALSKAHNENSQSILFINRRGYNNFLTCTTCGEVISCPRCSVSLTYHAKSRQDKYGHLMCHYCGHREDIPKRCPECSSETVSFLGFGTQKAEDTLGEILPNMRVMRMDADTTSAKFSFDKMLSDFRKGEADVLIGTQMVTKGHDFPNVSLVGVLLADTSLHLDDYRANERTFALVTQVIGRAGRGEKKGTAIIQTYLPDHPVLLLAAAQDYKAFYENDIAIRRSLVFPPFCDIVLISLSSADEKMLLNVSAMFAKELYCMLKGDFSDVKMSVFGPFEAPIYKINDIYHTRLVIKCRTNSRTRELLSSLMLGFPKKTLGKVTLTIDVNPASL
ncbi:MAG: primosomal protein N' [Ruminococcaceae bacterium]|nr:primosomal protein N' [Oscillospiraceae bacterium]